MIEFKAWQTIKNGIIYFMKYNWRLLFLALLFAGSINMMADGNREESMSGMINDDVKYFLENNPDGDFFVLENYICRKFDYDITGQNIAENNYLGIIQRTGIQNNWEMWDANKLKIGTKIYQHSERHTILIAVQDGVKITYIKNLEY